MRQNSAYLLLYDRELLPTQGYGHQQEYEDGQKQGPGQGPSQGQKQGPEDEKMIKVAPLVDEIGQGKRRYMINESPRV